jgi:hypothetical protein
MKMKAKGYKKGGAPMGMKTKGYAKGGATKKTKGYAKGGAPMKTMTAAKAAAPMKTKDAAMKTKGTAAMKTKGAAKGGARKPTSGKIWFIRAQIMAYLQSNIPHFKCWVRKEYTHNHEKYHGEFIHAMAIAVTTMPTRCLSFQMIFTGAETYDDDEEQNAHGGAMWARMPITALVADTPLEEWPDPMPVWAAQPWDCSSHCHAVYVLDRCTPCPWLAKIDGKFYPAKYYFTVDYSENEIADDPAQHKQSHVLELLDAGRWTGNIVALPNNRVRVTHPAWFETGDGAPDFKPSQHIHYSKSDLDYTLDVNQVFDNLYAETNEEDFDDEKE